MSMELRVVYGNRNVIYNVNDGLITWNNPLAILSKGGIHKPTVGDALRRDDLGGSSEPVGDAGLPLPANTVMMYEITTVGTDLVGVFAVKNLYDATILEDDSTMVLFSNINGEINKNYGDIYNLIDVSKSESDSYTDANIRTDQEIIDVVTQAGVTISDFGTAMAERISLIIDDVMKNESINDMREDLLSNFDDYGLDGQTKAELEMNFMTTLTTSVIEKSMAVGSQSMLTQKQADLAERQTAGFNDNLLVKANDSLAGTLGLINSGTGNTIGEIVASYSNTVNDLITRSKA